MTDASLQQYRIRFGARFSGDDLICKASDYHKLARLGQSPQQAIFHSPVLIAQYDYLVASVVLGARCCCSTGDKRLYYTLILFRTLLPFS